MRDFRQEEKKKLPQNKPSRDEPCLCCIQLSEVEKSSRSQVEVRGAFGETLTFAAAL